MRAWPWVAERMRNFRSRLPIARLLPAEADPGVADVTDSDLADFVIIWM